MMLLVLLLMVHSVGAYHFMVMHPLHSGSHEMQLRTLSNALVQRGHHITYIKFKNFVRLPPPSHPNITFITLAIDNANGEVPYVTHKKRGRFFMPFDIMWKNGLNPWGVPMDAFRTVPPFCDTLLGDVELRNKLKEITPDLAIVDIFTNECGLALVHHLKIPSVAYWALPLSGGEALFSSGLSLNPGVLPAFMTQNTDNMNILERARNLFYVMMNYIVMQIQFTITDRAIKRHLPDSPSSEWLLADLSGVLENSDWALDYPRELPPNVINVGCMQCRSPQPLPEELDEYMWGAGRAGVVVFSMGATFDAAFTPRRLFRRLLDAFSKLPQRVLMKYNGDLPNDLVLPGNVRIQAWLPQQDVLGHPQTRAFFTHCGLHGALETLWHGVPAVGLPVFGDQGDVAEMLKTRGVAERLDKDANTAQILSALRAVINDPRYRKNARRLQTLLQDQPSPPMERAIWFLEHVARHKGALHLRITSRHLYTFQKHGIDILAILALLLYLGTRWQYVLARHLRRFTRKARILTKRSWKWINPIKSK